MKIKCLEVGALKNNCYLVINENRSTCTVIDPGDEAEYITGEIEKDNLKPEMIVATHGHFDHIMAAQELRLVYKIPFFLSRKDEFLVDRLKETAEHFLRRGDVLEPEIDEYIDEFDRLELSGYQFELIKTPGHTPGGISLYNAKSRIVFVGDVIFKNGGIGRYDYSYCNKDDLYNSIDRLYDLPSETVVYSGHGEASSIKLEKRIYSSQK